MAIRTRPYVPIYDYDMIAEWWAAHGSTPLPDHLLSPIGFVAEDEGTAQAASFIYFDRNVPVCFVEKTVTVPGLSLREAHRSVRAVIYACRDFATSFGSHMLCVRAPIAFLRYALKNDFVLDEREIANMYCTLREEYVCQ